MPLDKEQRIIEALKSNPNIFAIQIITTSDNFQKRFQGNLSLFFRQLKNGLNSIQSLSNRIFFKNLSGCYFSLDDAKNIEIIILYDSSISKLNQLQTKTRIKKLLGIETDISIGIYNDYSSRIVQMANIVRESQTFGSWYFNR
jgi:hypothetical protein